MQLLSINTSLAKDVQFQGRNINTGIFKEPVSGPVRVRKLGLEGDQQADLSVHGGVDKAVYLYPSEHFAFWQDQYPERNFTPGLDDQQLLEKALKAPNLTTDWKDYFAKRLE